MNKKIKVLLLDDNKGDFIIVRGMLAQTRRTPFDLDWFSSLEKAREVISEEKHDVYLIDFRLGTQSGLELIQETLQNVKKPMILLTAHGNHEVDQLAIRSGAADYLPKKELSSALLERTIRHAIERNQLMEKLYYQATHDELTGLFNRQHLMERLAMTISSAKRHNFPLSLCLCDVDHFKSINDRYGHNMGDMVLHRIGEVFVDKLRIEDIPGRYGGDEFCIVFPYATSEDARITIERMRRIIEKISFITLDGTPFSTTITCGIATLKPDENSPEIFIASADQALYQAKEQGRNCTAIND